MSTYPEWLAGQKITAQKLNDAQPQFAYKSASTIRASTTVLTDDPDLQLTLSASATYFVEFQLILGAVTAEDVQTMWGVPSGATGLKSVLGPSSTAADSAADDINARMGTHQFVTNVLYSGVRNLASNGFFAYERGVITTTNSGTISLQWAQGTSGATGSRVFGGSLLIAKRIS